MVEISHHQLAVASIRQRSGLPGYRTTWLLFRTTTGMETSGFVQFIEDLDPHDGLATLIRDADQPD